MRPFPPRRPSRGGRPAVSFALLWLLLPACGRGNEAARTLPPGLELPVVGTLGRLPKGPAVIHVDVDEDGRIRSEGEGPLSLAGLHDAFVGATADVAWRHHAGGSRKILLLTADARLPWVVPIWILQTASHPRVQLWQIFLAAQARADGRRGALGFTLPRDWPCPTYFVPHPPISLVVRVTLHAGPEDDPELVAAPVAAAFASHPKHWVTFTIATPGRTDCAVPTGYVARILDAALSAGAGRVLMGGAPTPHELRAQGPDDPPAFAPDDVDGLLRCVAWFKARSGRPTLKITGAPDPARFDLQTRPPALGVLDRLYGAEVPSVEPGLRDVEGTSSADEPLRATLMANDDVEPMPNVGELVLPEPRVRDGVTGLVEHPVPLLDALTWLAAKQRPDGGWADEGARDRDIGVTGLALSAFLGAGHTNRGRHEIARAVTRGLRFLKDRQDADGCFGPRDHDGFLRDHAFAALAMIECFRMTGSPIFRPSADRALGFTRASYRRGWGAGEDPATTAWLALGLWSAAQNVAAYRESGRPPQLTLDEGVLREAVRSLPGAAGTALRQLLETEGTAWEAIPSHPDPLADPMATLWTTLATFKRGGDTWTAWSEVLKTHVLPAQRVDGDASGVRGSWDAAGTAGRVATTAVFALCLETYYRCSHAIGWR